MYVYGYIYIYGSLTLPYDGAIYIEKKIYRRVARLSCYNVVVNYL